MARINLNIGDWIVGLEANEAPVAALIAEFFAGFVTDRDPAGVIRVHWEGPHDLRWPDQWADADYMGTVTDGVYSVDWVYHSGIYHLHEGTGECRVLGIVGLQHFLWAVSSVVFPRQGGLILHASSVADDDQAFVFPAPSGTGKSTLVRNSPGHLLLSDDGSIVRLVNGSLLTYGSPFRSDNHRHLGFRRFPTRGVYFLRQGPEDHLEQLGRADALQLLLCQTFLCTSDTDSRVAAFDTANQIVDQTACYLLTLVNGGSFWGCIYDASQDETGTGVSATGDRGRPL